MDELYLETDTGRSLLVPGKQLGKGATGEVFRIKGKPGLVAKIYLTLVTAREHQAKVDAMLKRPPALQDVEHEGRLHKQIAWPVMRIIDGKRRFRGIVMPEIDFAHSSSLENLLHRSSRAKEKIAEFYGLRITVAANLAAVFEELHRLDHHMVDVKPINMRFYTKTGFACLIDCDGFSIMGETVRHAGRYYSEDYIAPEGRGRNPENLGVRQDRFALATIIFQLLNNGIHPFQFRSSDDDLSKLTLQERIYRRLYAYGQVPADYIIPLAPSIHESFPLETRALFDRSFTTDQRPSAAEWYKHLERFARGQGTTQCKKNKDHLFFGKSCPMCALVASQQKQPRPRQRPVQNATLPPSLSIAPPVAPISIAITPPAPAQQQSQTYWRWAIAALVALGIYGAIQKPLPNITDSNAIGDYNGGESVVDDAMGAASDLNVTVPSLKAEVAAQEAVAWQTNYVDDYPSGEVVSVTTKRDVNAREYPSASATKVTATLTAGMELSGKWVRGQDKTEHWLRYEDGFLSHYVWGRNLRLIERNGLADVAGTTAVDIAAEKAKAASNDATNVIDSSFTKASIEDLQDISAPAWYVIVGSSPPLEGGMVAARRKADRFETCFGVRPWTVQSDRIEGFKPGFGMTLFGGFQSKDGAQKVLAAAKACIPESYLKFGTYRG